MIGTKITFLAYLILYTRTIINEYTNNLIIYIFSISVAENNDDRFFFVH